MLTVYHDGEIFVAASGSNRIRVLDVLELDRRGRRLVLRPLRTVLLSQFIGVHRIDIFAGQMTVSGIMADSTICTEATIDPTDGKVLQMALFPESDGHGSVDRELVYIDLRSGVWYRLKNSGDDSPIAPSADSHFSNFVKFGRDEGDGDVRPWVTDGTGYTLMMIRKKTAVSLYRTTTAANDPEGKCDELRLDVLQHLGVVCTFKLPIAYKFSHSVKMRLDEELELLYVWTYPFGKLSASRHHPTTSDRS